jgi:hypothetical protein
VYPSTWIEVSNGNETIALSKNTSTCVTQTPDPHHILHTITNLSNDKLYIKKYAVSTSKSQAASHTLFLSTIDFDQRLSTFKVGLLLFVKCG